MSKRRMNPVIRFFNVVEPVTSLYRVVGQVLIDNGLCVEYVVTSTNYRTGGVTLQEWAAQVGATVISIPGPASYPRTVVGKAFLGAYYALTSFAIVCMRRKTVINVFLTQPPMFFVAGRLFRRWFHQPFICVSMDLYPGILVALKTIRPGGWFQRMLDRAARIALSEASAVVAIGRCMADRLKLIGVEPSAIEIIQNWPQTPATPYVDNPDKRPILTEWGLATKFVVLYSGNMGVAHTFEELISAAEDPQVPPDLVFLLVGNGVRRSEIEAKARKKNLNNIVFKPPQDSARAFKLMTEVDVHLVSQRADFDGLLVPSKAYSALAAGKALIYVGTQDGEVARMITDHAIGRVVNLGDPIGLSRALRELQVDKEELSEMGQRAKALAEMTLTSHRAANQYLELVKRVIAEASVRA